MAGGCARASRSSLAFLMTEHRYPPVTTDTPAGLGTQVLLGSQVTHARWQWGTFCGLIRLREPSVPRAPRARPDPRKSHTPFKDVTAGHTGVPRPPPAIGRLLKHFHSEALGQVTRGKLVRAAPLGSAHFSYMLKKK